jgi:hypothetical protein
MIYEDYCCELQNEEADGHEAYLWLGSPIETVDAVASHSLEVHC